MTDEEQRIRDLMTYGMCWWCGEPRRSMLVTFGETTKMLLVCYAGHDADTGELIGEPSAT
jgi:hypothetical protein